LQSGINDLKFNLKWNLQSEMKSEI